MQHSTWKKTIVGSAFLTGLFYVQTGEADAALGDQDFAEGYEQPGC